MFDYDPVRAAFIWKQTISTLPPDFTGTNTTAEIRIHPNGRFLYMLIPAMSLGHSEIMSLAVPT